MTYMKCTVCGQPAVVKIKRHRAKFCKEHFVEHIHRQVERVIKYFNMFDFNDLIGLAVSGGKDSLSGWNILTELGYRVIGVHINMGFGEFSDRSEDFVRNFAEHKGMDVKIYKLKEILGFSFEEALKVTKKPPCSLCGSLKRYVLNKIANDLKLSVIVTGHNLDDESAFLLGNVLYWKDGYLKRQYPVLDSEPGLVKKVKPFVRLTDEDLRYYAEVSGIDYYGEKCPNARDVTTYTYKDILNQLENNFNDIKTHFYFGFLKQSEKFKDKDKDKDKEDSKYNRCRICGYKTLNPGMCLVCSIKERLKSFK